MPRKIAVRVVHECYIDGAYRKPRTIFLVDRGLFEGDQLPSCVQRVKHERPAEGRSDLAEAREA